MSHPLHILFVCTGNSARSVLAEGLMNQLGQGRFVAHSAGSQPKGRVHPHALTVLAEAGLPNAGFRSKSWSEFSGPQAPTLDFVITVCDRAAGEVCPVWPGQPITAHWGIADPAEHDLSAFREAALVLKRRIELLLALPVSALDALSLQQAVRDIAKQ